VVINARTDLFLRQDGNESDRVDRAIARLKEAAASGADSLYPVGRHDPDTLRRLATELPLPINAIALPDQDDPGVVRCRSGWAGSASARSPARAVRSGRGDAGPLGLAFLP